MVGLYNVARITIEAKEKCQECVSEHIRFRSYHTIFEIELHAHLIPAKTVDAVYDGPEATGSVGIPQTFIAIRHHITDHVLLIKCCDINWVIMAFSLVSQSQ